MHPRFEQFIRERQILVSVTPSTVEWYRRCLKWLPSANPTQEDLRAVVVRMRKAGRKETGVNSVLRGLNAYLHWDSGSERRCGPGCNHPRIAHLREPRFVLPVFTEQQVKRLVTWKPTGRYEQRLHLAVLFLLDTGARISEALGVRVRDIDFDNLLVSLDGKGRKERLVPFSHELRRALFRAVSESNGHAFVFASDTGNALMRRNVLRDLKSLCLNLGFEPPARTIHAFRHTFAVNYLRRGGSVFHLQKVLGHSTLEMTRRYANLVTADLQAVHERVSLLSK